MRKTFIAAALLCMSIASASAQTPSIPPPGTPIPLPGGPRPILCTDLAIAGWNGTRSPGGGEPLAANEVAIHFHVINNGPRTYTAPSDSKQWISIIVTMPTGDQRIGLNVLPADSTGGPISLARGAGWRGVVRGTLPDGVTRASHPPARLQIQYAAASGGWSPPIDCNTANNQRSIVFR